MSDYPVKNLLEIEDSVGGGSLDARFARDHIGSEDLGVSLFRYAPDRKTTHGHDHAEQVEAYVVIAGSGRVRLDDEIVEVGLFDVFRGAPHVVRAFESGPEGFESTAVGGHEPHGGDAVLDADRWAVQ